MDERYINDIVGYEFPRSPKIYLLIQDEKLLKIKQDAFEGFKSLTTLYLNKNQTEEIEANVLTDFTKSGRNKSEPRRIETYICQQIQTIA